MTLMTKGRRRFLQGTLGASLALPFLPSVMRSRAEGQAQPRQKFISWRITNGHFGHQWYPSDEAVAAGGGMPEVVPNVREMRLADLPGPISTLLDAGFDPLRDKMTLLRHVDRLDHANHNPLTGLLGWSPDNTGDERFASLPPSIDHIMARHVFRDETRPLNLSVRWSESGRSCSVTPTATGARVHPGLYPHQAYQLLFGDAGGDPERAGRRRRLRASVVDGVLPEYRALRDGRRISGADRALLEQHIEHMHSLHRQLAAGSADCAVPDRPDEYRRRPEMVDPGAQAQVDIAVAALRCGLTDIVNFYLDPDTIFSEALHGVTGGHHGASHQTNEGAVRSIENAHRWHMRYLRDFVTKLDATPTASGTLLDDSLVFVNNEIGNQCTGPGNRVGAYDGSHEAYDVQTLLIGGAAGALRTGNYLDLRTEHTRGRWVRSIGTCYNRVLITLMIAMGLEPEHWEVGGEPGYGDLRGDKWGRTPLDQVVIGDLRAPLPRMMA